MYRVTVLYLLLLCVAEASSSHCGARWYKVFENDAQGNTVFGRKEDLVDAVLHGAAIRVIANDNYVTSVQNAGVIDGNVCAQALFHISKAGYDRFQDNAYWWFVNLCSLGYWQMHRYNVGEHVSRGNNEVRYNIQWFVRQKCNSSPILSVTSEGSVVSGSVAAVVSAVKNAEDIRITSGGNYAFPADNLEYDSTETTVGAMGIWHVSQMSRMAGGTEIRSFQGNDYWWFHIASSNGQRHMSRWNIGDHVSRGASSDTVATEWFSDPCWKQAYKHDGEGNQLSGSLTSLVQAVTDGHKVKLVYKRFSFEADELRVRNGHVTATVLNLLSKSGVGAFSSNVYWIWKQISTTGTVRTVRYEVGSNTYVSGTTTESETVAWFIDDREWKNVLNVNSGGIVTSGSKEVLVHSIKNGAEVRYRLVFDGTEEGYSLIQQADNLGISGLEVGAMHVRSVSAALTGTSEVMFQSNPYWWFLIAASTKRIDMSRWTVGVHEDRGHSSSDANINWFVNE